MDEVRRVLGQVSERGRQVNGLLSAIHVLLRMCEARLNDHAQLGSAPPEGALRRLAQDVSELHMLLHGLGGVTRELAIASRAELVATCGQMPGPESGCEEVGQAQEAYRHTLHALDLAVATVDVVHERCLQDLERLQEAALRKDVSVELREEVGRLLSRIARSPRAG